MKTLMVAFGSLFLPVGSNQAMAHSLGRTGLDYPSFRAELKRLGFDRYRRYAKDIYRYELQWLSESEWLEALDEQAEMPGFPFYHASGRMHASDGETLAEGGIAEQLDRLRALLRILGVPEFSVSQVSEPDYLVTVNNIQYTIFTGTEIDEAYFDLWGVATAVTLQILNDLLESAGSNERAYSLYGANDLHIVFLTDDMFNLYQRVTSIPERDKPQSMRPHGLRYFDD